MATAKTAARPSAPAAKPTPKPAAPAAKPAPKPTQPLPGSPAAKAQAQAPQVNTRVQQPIDQEKPEETTALTPQQTTAVVGSSANVPDYIRQNQGRGSENVEMQDLVIPRIELVQALSYCLEEGGADYIAGAKPGMFYNSVTRELYGPSVIVCPVFFKKQYLCWKDRKKGGGFGGAYDTMQEANERLAQETEEQEAWEAVETHQQIVLVVNPDTHETSEAVLSCARTKQKISRQWNSLIRVNGFDRFSRIYELFGVDDENNNGDKFKNIGVRYVDFASMPVYKAAETLYNSIASGERAVKIDETFIDAGMGSEDATTPGAEAGDPGAHTEY